MITTLMNRKRELNRLNKLPDDGDPWAPNNLLKPGAKEKTPVEPPDDQATDKKLRSQPIMVVDNYSAFFNCTPVGRASDSMMAQHKAIHLCWLGPEFLVFCLAHQYSTFVCFFFAPEIVSYLAPRDRRAAYIIWFYPSWCLS